MKLYELSNSLRTHKIIIPRTLSRYHEKSEESIREQHLNFFVVTWKIPFRIVTPVSILTTPVIAAEKENRFVSLNNNFFFTTQ